MNYGEKIAELREINNMSQKDLADRLAVSRELVSKWETGKTVPDRATKEKLAEIFGEEEAFLEEDKASENSEIINEFLQSLPERDRFILVRSCCFEESAKVIGKKYNIDSSYVRVILSRTRQKFSAFLKKYGKTELDLIIGGMSSVDKSTLEASENWSDNRFGRNKKIAVLSSVFAGLLVIVFLASCISSVDKLIGQSFEGYIMTEGENYYLYYSTGNMGKTELTAGTKKKHTVTMGTYCEADTELVDAFLAERKAARKACAEEHPEYEAYDVTDEEKGVTISYFAKESEINAYMNEKMNFSDSIFAKENGEKHEISTLLGYVREVYEVPGTDGKIYYTVGKSCTDVLFFIMAETVNEGAYTMEPAEFYSECSEIVNPPEIQFKLPWGKAHTIG